MQEQTDGRVGGQADRRIGGQKMRVWLSLTAVGLLTAFPPARLASQVGYDPAHSPYRDAPAGGGLEFVAGYFGGGRGRIPVGISDGNTWGARYNISFGSASLNLGAAYAQTTRRIVNPFVATANNTSALINCDVVLVDAGLQMALTGPKMWHHLAPYVGATLGLAFGSELATDTSGYTFGTKFTFGPTVGVRWYPARRISIITDFRLIFWRLQYPANYLEPNAIDGNRVLAVGSATSNWTAHPWISLGLGWSF
jgi:hypothetical protein